MELRGLVEQLQHEFSRLKSIQDDRYLELDARLQQALKANVSAPQPVAEDLGESSSSSSSTDENLGEKELYETIQILIRNRQYEMAITQLEALIVRFPDGEYTANTYYWLGQVQAAKTNPDFEKARQALAQVISYFPEHSKVPDAAYALGKVYYKAWRLRTSNRPSAAGHRSVSKKICRQTRRKLSARIGELRQLKCRLFESQKSFTHSRVKPELSVYPRLLSA